MQLAISHAEKQSHQIYFVREAEQRLAIVHSKQNTFGVFFSLPIEQ